MEGEAAEDQAEDLFLAVALAEEGSGSCLGRVEGGVEVVSRRKIFFRKVFFYINKGCFWQSFKACDLMLNTLLWSTLFH